MQADAYGRSLQRENLKIIVLGPGVAQPFDLSKRQQIADRLRERGYSLAKLGEELLEEAEAPLHLALRSELPRIDLLLVLNTGEAPLVELTTISTDLRARQITRVWWWREHAAGPPLYSKRRCDDVRQLAVQPRRVRKLRVGRVDARDGRSIQYEQSAVRRPPNESGTSTAELSPSQRSAASLENDGVFKWCFLFGRVYGRPALIDQFGQMRAENSLEFEKVRDHPFVNFVQGLLVVADAALAFD